MPLHSTAFTEYLPYVNDAGEVVEDRNAHYRRVSCLLPNFPEDVLGQWIYEHWSDVGRFDWLNFPSLKFTADSWTTEQVKKSGAARHEFVQMHRKHFESGDGGRRTERIAKYMRQHGTWPLPPLMVQNESGVLGFPGGGWFCSPYHPIEGQHRLGVFMSLATSGKLGSHHAVWRVSVASAA
jgi:hypothetical protein